MAVLCSDTSDGWSHCRFDLDAIDSYRSVGPLAYPHAKRVIFQGESGHDMVIYGARNTQATPLGDAFQARCQVDCRAVNALLLPHDIPHMQAHAEDHLALWRERRITRS